MPWHDVFSEWQGPNQHSLRPFNYIAIVTGPSKLSSNRRLTKLVVHSHPIFCASVKSSLNGPSMKRRRTGESRYIRECLVNLYHDHDGISFALAIKENVLEVSIARCPINNANSSKHVFSLLFCRYSGIHVAWLTKDMLPRAVGLPFSLPVYSVSVAICVDTRRPQPVTDVYTALLLIQFHTYLKDLCIGPFPSIPSLVIRFYMFWAVGHRLIGLFGNKDTRSRPSNKRLDI